jgi:cell division protein FtsQ
LAALLSAKRAGRGTEGRDAPGLSRWGRFLRTTRRAVEANDRFWESVPRHAPGFASAGFVGAFALYGLILGGHAHPVADRATAAIGFEIEKIEISGVAQTGANEILDKMGVAAGQSLLMLDVDAARARIAEISWVDSVQIRKLYPGRLVISLTERTPFALWQYRGEVKVIDKKGQVIADLEDDGLATLPFVVGHGADKRVSEAVDLLAAEPILARKIRAAVLVAERRWNLVTIDGVEIRLPEKGARLALADLARLDAEKQLLARDVKMIDLRVADRLAIRLSDEAADQRRKMLEDRLKKKGAG